MFCDVLMYHINVSQYQSITCTVPLYHVTMYLCTVPLCHMYRTVVYRTHVPCTVPMYHVPMACTQHVVPILAADLYDIAAKLLAISYRSAARIGTTCWVHAIGTWVRYMVHGYGTCEPCTMTMYHGYVPFYLPMYLVYLDEPYPCTMYRTHVPM